MSSPETSIIRNDGSYTFTSQSSETFLFRVANGFGEYVNYNPIDYKPQFAPVRGNVKETIGGGLVIQEFSQNDNDRNITFSMLMTKEEYGEFVVAKALMAEWLLTDYLGDQWRVRFDPTDGMKYDFKIKANDKTLIRFKFLVIASV